MGNKIKIIYLWTKDSLRLQGVLFESGQKDVCILGTHGMSGNFIENYFANVLGEILAKNGVSFIYAHNRGYNHINDILTKDGRSARIGAAYERFSECVYDMDAWLDKVREMGYKKIVLFGHSLGCNKTIHYFYKYQPKGVVGIILASPPDMVGLFEKPEHQPNHKELLAEAKRNIKEGNPRKLVTGLIWNWYNLSSQTYVDLSEQEGEVDNLPVSRNPDSFPELASINVPILGVMGEKDDIAIKTLEEDLALISQKATSCPMFVKKFIKDANHTYDGQEEQFSRAVLAWVKSL